MKFLILLTILWIPEQSLQLSLPSSPTYEAGVVEFNYERDPSITQASRTASNLASYLEIMRNAPATLDIVVFPEMTLNQMQTAVEIPEPKDKVSPCDSADYPEDNLVKQLSCSAKMYQRYVVVGIVTKVSCPDDDMVEQSDPRDCANRPDTMSYYNTNVVFDRNGTVVSRYRKFNLFDEEVDRPHRPSLAIFETDFGVTFGHFICFDILFRYPALELVRSENITDIIFPTMWYSELPFLTAVQVQQNWAFINKVNLLAAGANNPLVGSTGTGIFAGEKGSLISVMEGMNTTNLYTATVPKIGLGNHITINETSIKRPREEVAAITIGHEMLENYTVQFLNSASPVGLEFDTYLCHEEFCCNFRHGFERPDPQELSYSYAAVVYHGIREMDGFGYGITVCAVIACERQDITTCGVRNESLSFDREWHSLQITTDAFPDDEQRFFFPTTLDSSIMPFKLNEIGMTQTYYLGNSTISHFLKTTGTVREFYTFGLYGRDFSLDGQSGGTGLVKNSFSLIVAALTVVVVTVKSLAV